MVSTSVLGHVFDLTMRNETLPICSTAIEDVPGAYKQHHPAVDAIVAVQYNVLAIASAIIIRFPHLLGPCWLKPQGGRCTTPRRFFFYLPRTTMRAGTAIAWRREGGVDTVVFLTNQASKSGSQHYSKA